MVHIFVIAAEPFSIPFGFFLLSNFFSMLECLSVWVSLFQFDIEQMDTILAIRKSISIDSFWYDNKLKWAFYLSSFYTNIFMMP